MAFHCEKRVVVDLWGRFNDTIRVDHDFNHLEKLDGHMGWEWEDAIRAVGGIIAQPTLKPVASGRADRSCSMATIQIRLRSPTTPHAKPLLHGAKNPMA